MTTFLDAGQILADPHATEAQLAEIGSPLSLEASTLEHLGMQHLAAGELDRAAGCFMGAVNAEVAEREMEEQLARWFDDGGPSHAE